jgi:hypothetical protein
VLGILYEDLSAIILLTATKLPYQSLLVRWHEAVRIRGGISNLKYFL